MKITLGDIANSLLVWLSALWEYYPGRTWEEFLADVVYVESNMIVLRGGHRIYVQLFMPYQKYIKWDDKE